GERIVVVDSRAQALAEQGRQCRPPAEPLRLTLAGQLPQQAAALLRGQVGAAAATDPRTGAGRAPGAAPACDPDPAGQRAGPAPRDGAGRALVSSPAYDPNPFAQRLGAAQWRELIENPRHPRQNRVLESAFPPGSVFKIVVATAALAEGVARPKRTVWCPGSAE